MDCSNPIDVIGVPADLDDDDHNEVRGVKPSGDDGPSPKFKGRWFRLSATMIGLVKSGTWATLPPSAKAIYPVIWAHANTHWWAYPAIETIATLSGVSHQTVYRGILALEEAGVAKPHRVSRGPTRKKEIKGFTVTEMSIPEKKPQVPHPCDTPPDEAEDVSRWRDTHVSPARHGLSPARHACLTGGNNGRVAIEGCLIKGRESSSSSDDGTDAHDRGDDDGRPRGEDGPGGDAGLATTQARADLRRVLALAGVAGVNLDRLVNTPGLTPAHALMQLASPAAAGMDNKGAFLWEQLKHGPADVEVEHRALAFMRLVEARLVLDMNGYVPGDRYIDADTVPLAGDEAIPTDWLSATFINLDRDRLATLDEPGVRYLFHSQPEGYYEW